MTSFALPPRTRVYLIFFLYAVNLGAIFPRLADLQLKMGIGEGTLGMVLFGWAIGTQLSLMFAGTLIDKLGHRAALMLCLPAVGIFEIIATLMPSPVTFFFALMAVGLSAGAIEIMINIEADRTEHMLGQRLMNRAHAFWSLGYFTAGFVGALASGASLSPTLNLVGLVIFTAVVTFAILAKFTPAPARASDAGPRPKFVRPTRAIMGLVVFSLSAMLLAGAAASLSVIFMRDMFGTPAFTNGLAFAALALAQAITRFFTDGLVTRFGLKPVARTLTTLLGIGAILVTVSPTPAFALLGFALMGSGSGAILPLAMSAAAQRTDRPAAVNVAALGQFAFMIYAIAPLVLGLVAEYFGIRTAFGVGIPLVVASWLAVRKLG